MIIENINNENIKNELQLLEKKHKIIKEYVNHILSTMNKDNVFSAGYKTITYIVRDKNNIDQNLVKYVSYSDIINYLVLELNKRFLNYPFIEFIENMVTSALSLDNEYMLRIIDDIDSSEYDEYEKLSMLYSSINCINTKMNKK